MSVRTRFSPAIITALIVEPLRYFFSNYAGPDLVWNANEKIRSIDIGGVNNFHEIPLTNIPRVLINRGSYMVSKTGLTDNLSTSESIGDLRGASQRSNLLFVRGQATITIEARQEGTVELIADMVSHFLIWSRPLICSTQGFKEFGLDMQVSEPIVSEEDDTKFTVTITVPYMHEEQWTVNQDAIKLKGFFLNLNQQISGS